MIANLDSGPVRQWRATVIDSWRLPRWGEVAEAAMPDWLVDAMMHGRAFFTEMGSFRFENDPLDDEMLLLSPDGTLVLRLSRP